MKVSSTHISAAALLNFTIVWPWKYGNQLSVYEESVAMFKNQWNKFGLISKVGSDSSGGRERLFGGNRESVSLASNEGRSEVEKDKVEKLWMLKLFIKFKVFNCYAVVIM